MLNQNHLPLIENTILLTGKTGTGKSYLAKWIHNKSVRTNQKFLQLNIASLNHNLFESELFGHVKGSFTGATSEKLGFCERVGSGTLFLDEIGELNLNSQKKLLTLLEEKLFYKVGSQISIRFKGKFIFATNKNLSQEVKEGRFREDLYHRLRSYTFELKELSQRKEKEQIFKSEFEKIKLNLKKPNLIMSLEYLRFLNKYSFPGNYRELKQVIEYSCFLAFNRLEVRHLPSWVFEEQCIQLSEKKPVGDNFYDALSIFEKKFFEEKLRKYQGRINYTAQMIEISKVTLISKIRKYGINIQEFKINHVYVGQNGI